MSQNWMRHFELLLLDKDGNGIKFSDLKVTFQIQKMPATIFNGFVGNFKVYNLSKETQARILKGEFARVQVIAGYDGNPDASGNYPDRNVGLILTVMSGLPFPGEIIPPTPGRCCNALMPGKGILKQA